MSSNAEELAKVLESVNVDQLKIPHEYFCPITLEIMEDPVVAADGFSYERRAITAWLSTHNNSPKTGEQLAHRALMANKTLKIIINEFVAKIPQLQQQDLIRQDLQMAIKLREEEIASLVAKRKAMSSQPVNVGHENKLSVENRVLDDGLNAKVLLNARFLQKIALKSSYDEVLKQCQALVDQANLKMQAIITPLQEKREYLSRKSEMLSLQLQYLKNYEEQDLIAERVAEWQKNYQESVENLIQHFISDYKNLVAARDAIYRDGVLVSVSSREAKAKEVAQFEAKLRQTELLDYMHWQLPTSKKQAGEDYLLKEAEKNEALSQYEVLIDAQTRSVEQFYEEKAAADSPLKAIGTQLQDVLRTSEPENIIYTLCKQNNVAALKQQFPRKIKPKDYLEQHAPRALHVACEANQLPIVRYLIEEIGLSQMPDNEGYYPLHRAVTYVHAEPSTYSNTIALLEYLHEQGAGIDVSGPYHRSPLHTATLYGCLPGVTWLIAAGADINRTEKGRFQANTPLHNAAFAGHEPVVELLLLKGANPRLLNKSGVTALMEGILEGQLAVTQVFWQQGVWLSANDYEQLLKKPLTPKAKRCLEVPLRTRLGTSAVVLTEADLANQLAALTGIAQQKGWNCFDIAVGIEREQIVQYALENSANPEFRGLLAPEIRHAAAITVAYMEMNQATSEENKASVESQQILQDRNRRIQELFQIADVLKTEEERTAIESQAVQLLSSQSQEKSATLARYGLPSSMQIEPISQLVHDYFNAHEAMKKAVADCNDALGKGEGHRFSLEELEQWFSSPINRTQNAAAYQKLSEARNQLLVPAEQRFKAYCESEATYRMYVQDYYGASQWFAFQRQFADHQSTSMVDITARMLKAKIVIHSHLNREIIYSTAAYGANEIHIEFNGIDHFSRMPEANANLLAVSADSKTLVYSQVYPVNANNLASASSQKDKAVVLHH
jgi:uncharacterized protein YfcZ (UPF0381/DUF406 family)/DNA-binding phage protein